MLSTKDPLSSPPALSHQTPVIRTTYLWVIKQEPSGTTVSQVFSMLTASVAPLSSMVHPEDPLAHLYDIDDVNTIIQLGDAPSSGDSVVTANLALGDWWQQASPLLLTGYEATGVVPISDSGTVNGVGRFQGGPEVPFAVTEVVSGKRYRLRIINQSARNVFTVSIDNHPLILHWQITADQPVANYWLNAPFTGGSPAKNLHQNATLTRSILRYKGAPIAEPTTPWTLGPVNGTSLVEADLRPLVPIEAPPADINITMDLEVVAGTAIWTVNNVSYVAPKVPTLNQILDGATNEADFNVTENTFVLPLHKTVQISFPPTDDDDAHRLHLHGNNFWVVKFMSSPDINTVNPIRRDVVGVGGSGTIIRFRTDNAGPWFFHCHIFWHKFAGLATVMAVDPSTIREKVKPTKAWEALCPAYNALDADLQ
ncbi:hypothetical protein H0H92_011718 [Tricholoma furcatifolium]|nr:hypothetical protein H0H92_011718 [Tricholoma furcatifolium]